MIKHEQLHAYFIQAVDDVRSRLGLEDIGSFKLMLECSGRTLTDTSECKITYKICSDSWGSKSVEGAELHVCLDELLRRERWEKRNAPLSLPSPKREEIL